MEKSTVRLIILWLLLHHWPWVTLSSEQTDSQIHKRDSHLLFSFCINIIDHLPQHLFTGSGPVQSAADLQLIITCRQFESLGLCNLFGRCLPSLPFWRVPEQVAADLSAIWDHGGVVKKRLVSNLHLEKSLVSGGQLLGQRPQSQQHQQRHTPTFTVPHPVKTEDEHFSQHSGF